MRKFYLYIVLLFVVTISCNDSTDEIKPDFVAEPENISTHVSKNLEKLLALSKENRSRLNDSTVLSQILLTDNFYKKNDHQPIWSDNGQWLPVTSELISFFDSCRYYGLFPSDYHQEEIESVKSKTLDSLSALDAMLWTTGEILLTDAFMGIAHDIRLGRLPLDTITGRKDSTVTAEVFGGLLNRFSKQGNLSQLMKELEPKHEEYVKLKEGLYDFLDSAEFKRTTYISYPSKDSLAMMDQLQRRLFELDYLLSPKEELDSTAWKQVIRKYQKDQKLTVTGKLNASTVHKLNFTDLEKFKQVAVTMDKLKQIPDTLPATRVWVNIPAYFLKVYEEDTVALESRVIVGTSKTPTPEIVSIIGNFVTYPQWTVPFSIIHKEMIPRIQKDINYLAKQNLMVVDKDDNIIDPATINWSKMSKKYFPYMIKQRQGDDNSLGVMKFNFRNKHSVYLHDTNARWLFQKSQRSLSHGCVRVQKWKELAEFLVRKDTLTIPVDSLNSWISRKEKRVVQGFERVPIFIRYFTCEGREGKIRFYDDIYGSDKLLREKYFSNKL
jgi:murein L,D-transpeptidase YcbB/YkuD